MTIQNVLMLVILAITLVLFSIEAVSVDIIALGMLASLILTGLLPIDMAFAGFGNEAIILIAGLLILTAALVRTGVVDNISRLMIGRLNNNPQRFQAAMMVSVAMLSSFMSNTAAAALFIPIVMNAARKMRIHAARLLMPLAFAAILASSVTLIGTSTNIVVSGMLKSYGLAPIGMFELTPVGIPILIAGLLYMLSIGNRLIPERKMPEVFTEEFGLHPYLTEITILPSSHLVGKTLEQTRLGQDLDLNVLVLLRGKERFMASQLTTPLESGDILLVEGKKDDILRLQDTSGLEVQADVLLSDRDLQSQDMQLVEGIILTRSPLIGRTLKGINFRDKFKVQVLAIHRHEGTILNKMSAVPLRLGDELLLQGNRDQIAALESNNTLRMIGRVEEQRFNNRRAGLALGIFGGAVLLSALELVSLPVAILVGTVLAFLTRCITPEEAYREIDWKLIVLIGCMLAFGSAMEYTGTAKLLADQLADIAGKSNPIFLLSGFFLLTMLLTQPMSNQAAALVVLPIAIQYALHLGLNPRTFAMMIAVGASTSFITPLEPACLMIYGLGHYRFFDFIRVGSLLTIIIYVIAILLVPLIWPL